LKTEHNLGLATLLLRGKNYALGISASRTVITQKKKKEKKRKCPTRATEGGNARFLVKKYYQPRLMEIILSKPVRA